MAASRKKVFTDELFSEMPLGSGCPVKTSHARLGALAFEEGMKPSLFVLNDQNAPRLSPSLAKEIGLSESIIFLQLEFWVRTSDTEARDDRNWTYQSVRKIQKAFPFLGVATINRAIQELQRLNLIVVGNFNKKAYDKTRWFTIDFDGASKLSSIKVVFQNGTGVFQGDTRSDQIGTTIPERTTDTTTKKESSAREALPTNQQTPLPTNGNGSLTTSLKKEKKQTPETRFIDEYIKVYKKVGHGKLVVANWGADTNIVKKLFKELGEAETKRRAGAFLRDGSEWLCDKARTIALFNRHVNSYAPELQKVKREEEPFGTQYESLSGKSPLA